MKACDMIYKRKEGIQKEGRNNKHTKSNTRNNKYIYIYIYIYIYTHNIYIYI